MSNDAKQQAHRDDASKTPKQLEQEAAQSREDILQTVDRLQQSVSPGQLFDQARHAWQQSGGEFSQNLTRSVKNNPLPVLLSSIGLTWLIASDRQRPSQPAASSGPDVRGKMASGSQTAQEGLNATRESAANATRAARESADNATRVMQDYGERAQDQFTRLQREQPIMLGALGVALGAVMGGSLPRSEAEDARLGHFGDRARDALQQSADQAASSATAAVGPEPRSTTQEADRDARRSPNAAAGGA